MVSDGDCDDGDDDGDHLQLRETFLCWLTVRNIEVGDREGRQANSPSLTWVLVPDHKSTDSCHVFLFYPLSLGLNLWWGYSGWAGIWEI